MIKKKILEERNTSSKNMRPDAIDESKLEQHSSFEYLLNEKNILKAIGESLKDNDLQEIIAIVTLYKRTLRRAKLLKQQNASGQVGSKRKKSVPHSTFEGYRPQTAFANKK